MESSADLPQRQLRVDWGNRQSGFGRGREEGFDPVHAEWVDDAVLYGQDGHLAEWHVVV